MLENTTEVLPANRRVAMISGAARGIGLAIAQRLLADGYRVSLGVRDPEKARQVPEFSDPSVFIHRFDALDRGSCADWVDATVAQFGAIDALINNAGLLHHIDFMDEDEGPIDAMWEVNVKTPLRLIRLAFPHLKVCGHGRIINIASLAGLRFKGKGGAYAYAMTKFPVIALSQAARHYGWEYGIRVTALCPGPTDTPMTLSKLSRDSMIRPRTLAHLASTVLSLPNTASVAFIPVSPEVEMTY